jgi:Skp family chaperone for outer membrane proteins
MTPPAPSRRFGSKFVLVAAAASLVAGAALTSLAVPAMRLSKPAVIATVSLDDVFTQLNERVDAEGKLDAKAREYKAELDTLQAEIKNQEKNLEFVEGQQAKKDAAVKLIQTRANGEVRAKVINALLDQAQGEAFAALYRKIETAAKQMAIKNGYTLVVVTDESLKIPDGPSADIRRTISLKRFIYVDREAHDITGDLVTLMNNEFKAGVGLGAPPVAPGAPAPAAVPGAPKPK